MNQYNQEMLSKYISRFYQQLNVRIYWTYLTYLTQSYYKEHAHFYHSVLMYAIQVDYEDLNVNSDRHGFVVH